MRRREFTSQVRAEIVLRATNAQGRTICEGCGGVLKRGRQFYEIDHVIAEALVTDKSRKLTAKDGQLLGTACCHRGPDGKTAKDVAAIAQAKRREARHLGTQQYRKQPIRSAGFPKRPARTPKPSLPPVSIFTRGRLDAPSISEDLD